jgi:hypothetical protein
MIQILDTTRKRFTLTRVRSADVDFFATRNDTVSAIDGAVRNPGLRFVCEIYRKTNHEYVCSPRVTYYSHGVLSVGCHSFSGRSLVRLLKWAGVKP